MTMKLKKASAILVSGLLIFSKTAILAGCKRKTQKEVKTVAADSLWFNCSQSVIDDIYKGKSTIYYNNDMVGAYKDGIVFQAEGCYTVPDDFDWETDDEEEYRFYNIDYFDLNGKLIRSVDVKEANSKKNQTRIDNVVIREDGVYLEVMDGRTDGGKKCQAKVDLEKGAMGQLEAVSNAQESLDLGYDQQYFDTWRNGEYSVDCYENRNTNAYTFVISHNGENRIVDLTKELPKEKVFYFSSCLVISETELLLVCSYSTVKYLSLDLQTGKLKIKDDEYSWLDDIVNHGRISSFSGESYMTDQDGIKRINFATKAIEKIFSYNDCNINRESIRGFSLLSAREDKYVFFDEVDRYDLIDFDFGGKEVPTIIVFEKAQSNPNVGKKIITAASVGETDLSYPICEAIRIFNDTNEQYFIQLDYSYDFNYFSDLLRVEDHDERMTIIYKGKTDIYDQLAIDMTSGVGPDLILNAGSIRQIQTETHLLDLNTYLQGKNGISTEDFFGNVIDAAMMNDKLLYMPVGFSVSGIPARKSDVTDGQIGFTYEQYVKFVEEACGCEDPMAETQLGVLCKLFPYVSEACISGESVNFDNASFRNLCEYVKRYVSDKSAEGEVKTEGYDGMASFLTGNTYFSSKMTLLGYPSEDGRGPYIHVDMSLGISASAPSVIADGAWELIKSCLSDEVQDMVARDGENPISKTAFDSSAKTALKNYNRSELSLGIQMDESVINSYREVLLSASVIDNADPTILSVIREEVPAFLLNQKSMEEVLSILKNRVTTIINERNPNSSRG